MLGGSGLMSMMSLNVLDRTREIGMLPVVGGSRKVIAQIVVTEGMFKGSLSWLFGSFWPTRWGITRATNSVLP